MRVAIIGAQGFAGSHMSAAFAAAGHRVAAIGRGDALPDGFFDVVVDCNGDPRRFWANENPALGFDANVTGVVRRLTGMDFGVYVYLSTVDVYGSNRADRRANHEEAAITFTDLETYGFQKWTAERQVEFFARDHIILRLGTLIGPGLKKNPIFDALNNHPIRQTADSTLTLVSTGFAARATLLLLENGLRGIYNVTGNAPVALPRVLELAAGAVGRRAGDLPVHAERIRTDYDINTDKLAALLPVPSAQAMLEEYLEGPR